MVQEATAARSRSARTHGASRAGCAPRWRGPRAFRTKPGGVRAARWRPGRSPAWVRAALRHDVRAPEGSTPTTHRMLRMPMLRPRAPPLGSSMLGPRALAGPRYSSRRHLSLEPTVLVHQLTETLQAVHQLSGLPWWAVIPAATFGLRAVGTLPLAVMQRLRLQRQNALRPIVAATGPVLRLNLAKKAHKAAAARPTLVAAMVSPLRSMKYEEIMVLSTKETRRRQKRLFRDHGVPLYKNLFLPAAQIPLWVCMSLTFRNLSGWASWDSLANRPLDAALHHEGALWFADLTAADPVHMFPLAVGIVALVNVEWTFRTLNLVRSGRKLLRPTVTDSMANVSRMAVVFLMAISLHAPTALTLYWLSSQVFSLVQNVMLDIFLPLSYTPHRRLDYRRLVLDSAVDVVK